MEAIANYTAERNAFAALWRGDCAQRIVFYRGQSGSGKSTLLRSCYKAAPNTLHKEFIDLKPGTVNVADIFSRLERRLGAAKLPRFRQRLLALNPGASAQIDGNQIQGSGNLLNITLNTDDSAEREDRRIALTDAWLDDVQALDRPLLIVMDTPCATFVTL